jgi:uncharacterized damage-inducible protein DinB
MLPMLEAYRERLEALHTDIHKTLTGLPLAALDWLPGAEMNSLAVLASHVAGSERYWVGEVAGGDPSHRDRPTEFHIYGLNEVELSARLDATLAHSRMVLERLTSRELELRRPAADRGEVTVAWALFHNLQHVGMHLGQMQLTRQLWEQQLITETGD